MENCVTPYDRVLVALETRGLRVRRQREGTARAQCPCHPDGKPSLQVTWNTDRVLIYCFARCRTSDVLQCLGLTLRDLYSGPSKRQSAIRRIVATYVYTDLNGHTLAEKVRLEPKEFRWRIPDASAPDGYRWTTAGIELPVFDRPFLIDAKQVLLVEGEKAVERLRELGFFATCPPAGASSWHDRFAEQIWRCGAVELVILADADVTGRRHAEHVATRTVGYRPRVEDVEPELPADELEETGFRVKVVDLPGLSAGGDVVDWLETHSAADLRTFIECFPYWKLGLRDELRRERKRSLSAERQRRFRVRKSERRQHALA